MQIDALIGSVLIQAPGVSDILAVDALRKAAIQLCEQSSAWKETITQATTTQEVELDIPAQSRVTQIRRVFADGDLLVPLMPDQTDPFDASGKPHGYYRSSDNVLMLVPAPTERTVLTVEMALAPSYEATTLPDDLGNRCRIALIHGALAYLLAIPGHPWTQPVLASAYQQMFDRATGIVAVQDNMGRVRAALRVRSSFF